MQMQAHLNWPKFQEFLCVVEDRTPNLLVECVYFNIFRLISYILPPNAKYFSSIYFIYLFFFFTNYYSKSVNFTL